MGPDRLVLASASPRRRELLGLLGRPFDVIAADVDETPRADESPETLAERLARDKATAAAATAGPRTIVVAADTVVAVEEHLLGKPADLADARTMIASVAGREHRVITGVAVSADGRLRSATETTRVWFRSMTDAELDEYAATGEGLDKAGGYGIQGLAGRFVERIDGSWHNVVGLPLVLVESLLAMPAGGHGDDRR